MTDGTAKSERELSFIHRVVRQVVFKRSEAFIAASDGSLELFRSYGIPVDKVFKSPLCVDNERFGRENRRSKVFDLMFCSRFADVKQPLLALDVAERVADALGRSVSILLVGSGELEVKLREKAENLVGVISEFHGFASQEELPGLYASAKVFLFPTKWDPWGVVVNEACAAGLPIVSTPVAGVVGEIVQDGVNGYVRELDIDEWALVVSKLLEDRELYKAFSGNSVKLVAEYNYIAAADGIVRAAFKALGRREQ